MDDCNNLYPNLGSNIRALRRAANETLLELAIAVEGSNNPSKFSQYETGKSVPLRDTLIKIAKHYMITEDELLYGDFSNLKKPPVQQTQDNNVKQEMLLHFLPIVHSEIALKNKKFKTAYDAHIAFLQKLLEGEVFDWELYDKLIIAYELAENDGIIEAVSNHLSCIMLVGAFLSMITPEIYYGFDKIKSSKFNSKDFYKKYILPSFDEEEPDEVQIEINESQREFVQIYGKSIVDGIYKLKKSKTASELGDFFLALQYRFNLLPNSLSSEMNRTIGEEMMNAFERAGNKYAKDYFSYFEKLS